MFFGTVPRVQLLKKIAWLIHEVPASKRDRNEVGLHSSSDSYKRNGWLSWYLSSYSSRSVALPTQMEAVNVSQGAFNHQDTLVDDITTKQHLVFNYFTKSMTRLHQQHAIIKRLHRIKLGVKILVKWTSNLTLIGRIIQTWMLPVRRHTISRM